MTKTSIDPRANGKQVVKYNFVCGTSYVCEGSIAFITSANHPRFQGAGEIELTTSTVLKKYDDGAFETKNTFYIPE